MVGQWRRFSKKYWKHGMTTVCRLSLFSSLRTSSKLEEPEMHTSSISTIFPAVWLPDPSQRLLNNSKLSGGREGKAMSISFLIPHSLSFVLQLCQCTCGLCILHLESLCYLWYNRSIGMKIFLIFEVTCVSVSCNPRTAIIVAKLTWKL